jgi:hypothetical protein
MAISIELFAYPWDILDTGVARFADECRELGVTRVHVTTVYHSGKFLLPRNSRRKVHLLESGTAWVPLDLSGVKPVSPVLHPMAGGGWLEELARTGIALSAWTVFHHSSPLGLGNPSWTVRNVYGDAYPYALCPSHEPVCEYSTTLAKAVAVLGCFDTIDLESIGYLGYVHGHHHEVQAGPLGPLEYFLLSLCFCEACRKAASREGIDSQRLSMRLIPLLDRKLNADDSNASPRSNMEQIAALLAQDPELGAFVRMRMNRVTKLVRAIADETGAVGVTPFTSSFVGSPSNIWMEGVSISDLRDVSDSLQLLAYTSDTGSVNDDLLFCLSQAEDSGKLNLTLNLGLPITPSLADAMAKVHFARKQGVSRFSFFNYGFLGSGRLRWIAALASALAGKTD